MSSLLSIRKYNSNNKIRSMGNKKKRIWRWVALAVVVLFIVLQFFKIDTSVPKFDTDKDFIAMTAPSDAVVTLLKNACYDCHSYATEYPWYAEVTPISWWLQHHVEEGREHLNFSLWGTYSTEKSMHKLEECTEEVEGGEMPLKSYTFTHGDVKLSAKEKATLVAFFDRLRKE